MRQKIIKIGNTKGEVVPQAFLIQYCLQNEIIKLCTEGLLLKPIKLTRQGWKEQFEKAKSKVLSKEDKEFLDVENSFDKEEWTW
jgi:antitoxin component of MazEF toxin-antitoxin module